MNLRVHRLPTLAGGLVLSVLALPHAAFAVSGCSNQYLMGTYNGQITSLPVSNVLFTMNGGATGTAVPGSTGFGSNPASLAGNTVGLSRFFFDGSGNIVGNTTSTPATSPESSTSEPTPLPLTVRRPSTSKPASSIAPSS